MRFKCHQSKIWNTLKVRNIPHSTMFHKSILKTLDTNSPNTFTASPAQMKQNIHCIRWQLFLGWGVSIWWNTFGGSGGMSWCWRNTWSTQRKSTLIRLGFICGNDRISWFLDFAAPIFGCWCGHTCHWCNRQHWVSIQLVEGVRRM